MSLSWIETLRKRGTSRDPAAGIALRPGYMDVVRIDAEGTGGDSGEIRRIELPELDLRAGVEAVAKDELTRRFQDLAASFGSDYRRVFVSLPDPLARVAVLRFGHIPRRPGDLDEIVAWRMRKEFDIDPDKTVCRWQRLGADGQSELVYVTGLDMEWLAAVNCACDTAGLTLSGLDIESRYAFNYLLERESDLRGAGVLIDVSEADFSFLAWDEQKRPRLLRSRWRESVIRDGLSSSAERVVAELERIALAYLFAPDGASPAQVYLSAPQAEAEYLADELRRRLPLPVLYAAPDLRTRAVALGQ